MTAVTGVAAPRLNGNRLVLLPRCLKIQGIATPACALVRNDRAFSNSPFLIFALAQADGGQELGNGGAQSGEGHEQHEDIADGHADPQSGGLLVAFVDVLPPQQQQNEQAAEGSGHGGGNVGHEDQLRGRTAVAVADDHGEDQAGQAAPLDELALQGHVLVEAGAQQHHAALGIGKQ